MTHAPDRAPLDRAARLAWRGHGFAEPNPLVGCVMVDDDGKTVGSGYHRHFGGAHAEVNALRAAGGRARGATAWVTLEPCGHHGKTPPCSDALIEAGVSRVVCGHADPVHSSAMKLAAAGIPCEFVEHAPSARLLGPFLRRLELGRPWITVKWAQTLDGRIATHSGHSQWISSHQSRLLVHRERGRVCAIMTGIGTVRSDDPKLTARDVQLRRVAKRVVIDPAFELSTDSALMQTTHEAPLIVYGDGSRIAGAEALRSGGAEVRGAPVTDGELDLDFVMRDLVTRDDVANVLVEAGPGLVSRLFGLELVDEVWAFIAPKLAGDDEAVSAVHGFHLETMDEAQRFSLQSVRRRGGDVIVRYARPQTQTPTR